jgi:hypothetical protein
MTFILSAYMIIMVSTYHTGVRTKTRSMMYGASNAVDTIVASIDYDHPDTNEFLSHVYGAMTAIGGYGLINASKSCRFKLSKQQIINFFEERNLDGEFLLSFNAPKQVLHILRLAILQLMKKERNKDDGGCLKSMSDQDWQVLRTQLNNYCGGASQTSSSVTSSKLPYPYVQFVNWSTHAIVLFHIFMVYKEEAEEWNAAGICFNHGILKYSCNEGNTNATFKHIMNFVLFNVFEIVRYYVMLCLIIICIMIVKNIFTFLMTNVFSHTPPFFAFRLLYTLCLDAWRYILP